MAYWLAAAAILFVMEMFIGTVYLLVLSAAFVGAGLTAWLFDNTWSIPLWVAGGLSLIGVIWVYQLRQKQALMRGVEEVNNDLDIGETVILNEWLHDDMWRVSYRGTQWEARFTHQTQEAASGGTAKIVGKDGIVLLIH